MRLNLLILYVNVEADESEFGKGEKKMTQLNNDTGDNNINDVSIMSLDTACLEGIREALKVAMLTDQIVEVGLICCGEPKVVEGLIVEVSSRTFCIRTEDNRGNCQHDAIIKFNIEDVEYVEFC